VNKGSIQEGVSYGGITELPPMKETAALLGGVEREWSDERAVAQASGVGWRCVC
jgi:hypothetical protein